MRIAALLAVMLLATACEREQRRIVKPPQPPTPAAEKQTALQPGGAGPGPRMTASPRTYDERNAFELAQGKRLYKWFNCNGCHASGGGGIGPPLMDSQWLYGSEPAQIFATIMQGRPNGMPAFQGRLPEEQAWQIVGYVRSMSGLTPQDARPGRGDGMQAGEPESRRVRQDPQQ